MLAKVICNFKLTLPARRSVQMSQKWPARTAKQT